ncbi:MAG: DUF2637 domain-containing protein [Chloroflexi bacterium]|nr:DUF2637 domain-containing protein [Chloroflexota bacterium]MCI0731848.1 DUF2637 domain-containing protein [Chloroflexota bacterium]
MQALAVENGVAGRSAWLYPAIIDGAIVVFSLSVVQVSLNKERPLYPWLLVGLFTVLSVALNVLHAERAFLARVLAAVPPIALFLSFELLMNQVKAAAGRSATRQSLAELESALTARRAELDEVVRQKAAELDNLVRKWTAKLERLQAEVEQLQSQKAGRPAGRNGGIAELESIHTLPAGDDNRPLDKAQAQAAVLDYLAGHPKATLVEIAAVVGRSKSTIGTYLSELKSAGRLIQNGAGWEVTVRREGPQHEA